MAEVSVKLLGLWGSPFTLRVKCVFQNQYVEEGLSNKNAMLLQYNPKGKSPAESLLTTKYINETWKQKSSYSI